MIDYTIFAHKLLNNETFYSGSLIGLSFKL